MCALALLAEYRIDHFWMQKAVQLLSVVILILVLQFFRNPKRKTIPNEKQIISPVDGKVVDIEEVFEKEFFKDKRLQVSIFMSPINVHVTRYAISGSVIFSKYHPGKYLVAWHPKSSELNERTTIVVENKSVGQIFTGKCRSRCPSYRQLCQSGRSSGTRSRCRIYKIWFQGRFVFTLRHQDQC